MQTTRTSIRFPLSLLLILILLCAGSALATQPLVLRDTSDTFPLDGSSLDILEDASGRLTITDVTSSRLSGSFKQSRRPIPNFGLTNSAFWFRFTVDGRMRGDEQWILLLDQPIMHEVDLFIPRGDGSFDVK